MKFRNCFIATIVALLVYFVSAPLSSYAFASQQSGRKMLEPPSKSILSSQSRENSGTDPIVFVHGWSFASWPSIGSEEMELLDRPVKGCDEYWGEAMNYMRTTTSGYVWRGNDFRTVAYYNADKNCTNGLEQNHSYDLHASEYATHCENFPANRQFQDDGAWNETISHISCLFAWYLYYNFAQTDSNVEIVAHSMGGLIVRNAFYYVQYRDQLPGGDSFPLTLGRISDVVDFNTPHQGHQVAAYLLPFCNLSKQCQDMDPNSDFIQQLNTDDRASTLEYYATDWTLIGSECDNVVNAESAVGVENIGHKIVYDAAGSSCYGHGDALNDVDESTSARQWWCDWEDDGRNACNVPYQSFRWNDYWRHGLYSMALALWTDQG